MTAAEGLPFSPLNTPPIPNSALFSAHSIPSSFHLPPSSSNKDPMLINQPPIVVQGRTVKGPQIPSAPLVPYYGSSQGPVENYFDAGSRQTPTCRDSVWALLFVGMILAYVVTSILYVPLISWSSPQDANLPSFSSSYLFISGAQALFASGLAVLSFSLMLSCSFVLIQGCLLSSVVMQFLFSLMSLVAGNLIAFLLFLFFGMLMMCYARAVWSRIPFAAANLNTGITCIKKNLGVCVYAVVALVVAVVWSMCWMVNALAIAQHLAQNFNNDGDGDGGGGDDAESPTNIAQMNAGIIFLLLVSFYWVHQVISGVVHTTTAGIVGTWWFNPSQASKCCSNAVTSSFFRATTYSFGSICLGSLVVAIIQAIRALVSQARQSDDGLLACLADCILSCLESIAEYFNRW